MRDDADNNIDFKTISPICQDESDEQPFSTIHRSKRIAERKTLIESANVSSHDNDPKSYKEATELADCKEWLQAMEKEMDSLKETKTYELTDLPPNKIAIGCKWVLKRKQEIDAFDTKLDW